MPDTPDNLMKRTKAAVRFVNDTTNAYNHDNAEIEAFMALFHPEVASDRKEMRELKKAMGIKRR